MASRIENDKPVFEYPAVESAYVPSGRMGPNAAFLLASMVVPSAVLVGALLAALQLGIAAYSGLIGWLAVRASGWMGLLPWIFTLGALALANYMAATAGIGFPLRYAARRGLCRSREAIGTTVFVAGFLAAGTYAAVVVFGSQFFATGVLEQHRETYSWFSTLAMGVACLTVAPTAWMMSRDPFADVPFCESCRTFMTKSVPGVFNIDAEGQVVALVNGHHLSELRALLDTKSTRHTAIRTFLEAWRCPHCVTTALLEAQTHLTWVTREISGATSTREVEKFEIRKVASVMLSPEQTAEFNRLFGEAHRADARQE